jgi:hypothetical protein
MPLAHRFRHIAMSLDGTTEAPHVERTAFKVARIYATLAPDGLTANLKLSLDEQELKSVAGISASTAAFPGSSLRHSS